MKKLISIIKNLWSVIKGFDHSIQFHGIEKVTWLNWTPKDKI